MILLACAVERELGTWTPPASVTVLITGVGPVESACAVTRALAESKYDLVVSAGIGGAFDGAARIGDGVVVAEERFELSREDGSSIVLPDGEPIVETARSEPSLVRRLQERGVQALHGITVSRATSAETTAERLARDGAQIESLEGFAVLRACRRASVAAIEVRGISNRVGARERSGWDFAAGVAGCTRVLTVLFEIVTISEQTASWH